MAINYGGLKWDLFIGKEDGTGFKRILGVSDASFDNSSDDVTRNFIDGDSLKLTTNFTSSLAVKLTDIGQENLTSIVPGYVYATGETIDGVDGVTVGAGGAVSVGVEKGASTQVAGVLKLVPKLAAQAEHTLYMFGAIATITDITLDDLLQEFEITISGKLVKGDIAFTAGQ